MLQFIFGKPASGKSYTVIQKIKDLTLSGKDCVLIVPEQFTFESERAVLNALGEKAMLKTEVLSFTRLCDEVGRKVGGICGKVLRDCDKVIFICRALDNVKSELKLWGRYTSSVNFAKTLLDAISELKINGVSQEDLKKLAQNEMKPILHSKLLDLAKIYEEFNLLISEKFIDPSDKLTHLNQQLKSYHYFENKTVFFDSFKGFTGQQYKILEQILLQSEDVYITFTNDVLNSQPYNVYTNIRKAIERITRYANNNNILVGSPIILNESEFVAKGIADVEKIISGGVASCSLDSSVNICCAANAAYEADYAVRTIKRLVRSEGYRFKDFVIIARESETYREKILLVCQKNDISLFFDNRIPLSAFPLSRAIVYAIKALRFSTEAILNFHKTGLGTLSTDEISILENYTYLWGISGKLWLENWDMNPNGFSIDENVSVLELEEINKLRLKAIEPILFFNNNFNGNTEEMTRAVVKLIDFCNCREKLADLCEVFGEENNNFSADFLKLAFEEYMNILDSLVTCFAQRSINREIFTETLNFAVSMADIGVIPQTLDQVTFGSADRIRPSRPKIAFILGANQGVFPKNVHNSGVFSSEERKVLLENGLEISDNSVFSAIDEEFLVYCNVCCPSEKLFITYSQQTVSGEVLEPSTFLRLIIETGNIKVDFEPQENLNVQNLPETVNSALSEFSHRIRSDSLGAKTIKSALINNLQENKLRVIEEFGKERFIQLSPETATRLFGNNIRMSASRFDNYNRCHFSYFCRYGLKAQKIQPADFDVMQRGTIVHFVLERFINDYKENFDSLDDNNIGALIEDYISQYLDSISGFASIRNLKTDFIVDRITRSLKEVIAHVVKEIRQSSFKPVACELKIGENSSLKFPFDNGNIILNGSIDRVDEYNGYIRIIDYKTGSKNFKLPDILFGLNLQMLIYLYAVTRAKGLNDTSAAGILYQPSRRDINDIGLAMNGLLQAQSDVIMAMDSTFSGEFVPKLLFNKDGTVSKRSSSFIETERFTEIFDYIEELMKKTGNAITSGDISVSPLDGRESPACKYCDYKSVCGIENREIPRVPELKNDEVFEIIGKEQNYGI